MSARRPGLTIFTEDRFGRDADGVPAALDGGRGSAAWAAYVADGRPVTIAARTHPGKSTGSAPLTGVEVAALPYYVGVRGLLRTLPRLVAAVVRAVRRADYVVLRVPGPVTSIAAIACRILRRPYAVDVVGDAVDAVSGGALGGAGRCLARPLGRHTRWVVRHAGAARYVTRQALQARYPAAAGRPNVGVSDVRLGAGVVAAPRRRVAGSNTIVTVGTMESPYKGQDVLLRALPLLVQRGVDVRVELVGGGRLQPELEALAAELGVADRVRFHGVIDRREDLNRVLDTADLFVLASRQEGLPRALVEAMARALPAVATRVGGVGELLADAALVGAENPDALAEAIATVLGDRGRWEAESARNLAVAGEYAEPVLAARFGGWLAQIPAARRGAHDQAVELDQAAELDQATELGTTRGVGR